MFRRLSMAIFRLYMKYLVSSYTRLIWAVYSGEVGDEMGTRSRAHLTSYLPTVYNPYHVSYNCLLSISNFDVLLTVHLSIFISVINQLDAQNFCFTISLFHASTCFEHTFSSSGGQNCITEPLVSSH